MPFQPFDIIRAVLRKINLSSSAVEDIIDHIQVLLADNSNGSQEVNLKKLPYRISDNFLSNAERSFYLVLRDLIGDQRDIFTKVSLGDLFYVTVRGDESQFRTYRNKIDRKHVDFLICNRQTLEPVVGIELDDKSHQREDRQERDRFVEAVFACANLPLVRFPARRAYSANEITAALAPYLNNAPERFFETSLRYEVKPSIPLAVREVAPAEPVPPQCPKCGAAMKLRIASKGANPGAKFWGCSNYPNCRGIIPIQDVSGQK
jgi:very-short-patch-repair endonuclease